MTVSHLETSDLEVFIQELQGIRLECDQCAAELPEQISICNHGHDKEHAANLFDAGVKFISEKTALNALELRKRTKQLQTDLDEKASDDVISDSRMKFDTLLKESERLDTLYLYLTRRRDDLVHQLAQARGAQRTQLYNDMLTSHVKPIRSKPPPPIQKELRRDILRYYNVYKSSTSRRCWCPIYSTLRESTPHLDPWLSQSYITAVPIIPPVLCPTAVNWVFGIGDSQAREQTIMSWRNYIPMASFFEEAFNRGWFAIVPVPETRAPSQKGSDTDKDDYGQPGRTELMCVILDNTIRDRGISAIGITWGAIDGLRLTWKGDTRPRRRFLYLRWVINYLAAVSSPFKRFDHLDLSGCGTVWLPAKTYLRRAPFITIAQTLGEEQLPRLLEAGTFEDSSAEHLSEDFIGTTTRAISREVNGARTAGTMHRWDYDDELEDDDDDFWSPPPSSRSSLHEAADDAEDDSDDDED